MSSGLVTSVGVRFQRLLTTAARRQLQSTSFVVSSLRHQSTNVDEDDQVVVVDSKRLSATPRQHRADHLDRHVRSSGKRCFVIHELESVISLLVAMAANIQFCFL